MKERPILFNSEMVNAILEGRKTQTRKVVKHEYPLWDAPTSFSAYETDEGFGFCSEDEFIKCPFGKIGDRLWVRETWGKTRQCDDINHFEDVIAYKAGHPWHVSYKNENILRKCRNGDFMEPNHFCDNPFKWIRSTHMPRWASRITLEITNVRIERLQDIGYEDIMAEGVKRETYLGAQLRGDFIYLWNSINKKRGLGWDENPWVWVIEFEIVQGVLCH